MWKIDENLFIGNRDDSRVQEQWTRNTDIWTKNSNKNMFVLNVAYDSEYNGDIKIGLMDGEGNDPILFDMIVDTVNKFVPAKKNIIVCCNRGESRSVCSVAIYMVVKLGLDFEESLERISLIKFINPREGLLADIRKWLRE